MSFGGAFENIETIGNKSKSYGNDPGPDGGWNGFNLENFGKDIKKKLNKYKNNKL